MPRPSRRATIASRLLQRRDFWTAPPVTAGRAAGSLLPLALSSSELSAATLSCALTAALAFALIVALTRAYRRTVSSLRASQAALTRRMQLEEAILQASKRLINVDLSRVDEEINHVLAELGQFEGADRAYVFLLRPDGTTVDCTHEWRQEGVSPQIATLQGMPVSDFPWLAAKLLGREVVLIRRVSDLPPEAKREREQMLRQGVESMIAVPLESGDTVIGFVGFDSVTAEDAWTDETLIPLRSSATCISNVLGRRRMEKALRESEARYRQFLHISAEGIWRLEIQPPIPTDLDPKEQAGLMLQRAMVAECNEMFAHRNGAARPEELIGTRLDDLWLAPREAKLAALAQAARSGYRIVDLESTAPLPDGSQGYFLDNFVGVVEGGFLVGAWGTERDITRRRRAEEELRRERDLVKGLLETSPIGITAVDREGRITFANAGAERVLGLAKDETTGLTYNDPRWRITDHAGQPISDEEMPFRKVQASGQAVYDVRHAIEHPNGRRVLLSINATPIFTEAGEFDGMVASIEDVTETCRAEEALRESEQRFRAIVESTRDWIWFCGADGVHRYSNRAVEDLLGYPPEEIVGRSIVEFMHPEDRAGAMARMQRAIAQRSGWSALLLRWRHKDGTDRYLESAAAPAFDADGELTGWYGADRDITERIQMQEALGRSEARLRALFAAMTDVILVMDDDGRYLEVAPTKPDLLYRPPDEVLGKTVAEVFPAELADFFLDHIRRALSLRRPVSMVYSLPIGDRNVRFAAEVSPLSENSVLIVARDVTAQTEQYEQWLATERARASLAEHLNAEINHRARNNLAMVSGLLQMQVLQEPDEALASRLREAVARIRTFVDIHEKIYATGAEQVDLLEVLRQVADTLRAVFSNIGAVFSVEGESLPCRTRAATNLAVVTNELITNALKYGGPGRDGRLHVVVQLLRGRGQLKITVQNSGTPVRADFDAATQPGMGLRLTSDMAAQHGGTFSLRPVRGGNLATLVVDEAALQE